MEFMTIFFDNLVFMTIESHYDYTKYSHIGCSSYNLNLPNLISLKIHFPSTPFGSWKWSRTLSIFIYLVFHSLNNMLSFFFLNDPCDNPTNTNVFARSLFVVEVEKNSYPLDFDAFLSSKLSHEWPPLPTSTKHN